MALLDRDHVRRERIRVFPPLIPITAIAAAWLLDGTVPVVAMTGSSFLIITGAFWLSAGAGLMTWAIVHQYRRGTDPNPFGKTTTLVTDGPYGLSRNPIYCADLLMQTGIGLLLAWEWALLLLPVTWAGLRFLVIRNEERFLAAAFAAQYAEYRSRVRRWL